MAQLQNELDEQIALDDDAQGEEEDAENDQDEFKNATEQHEDEATEANEDEEEEEVENDQADAAGDDTEPVAEKSQPTAYTVLRNVLREAGYKKPAVLKTAKSALRELRNVKRQTLLQHIEKALMDSDGAPENAIRMRDINDTLDILENNENAMSALWEAAVEAVQYESYKNSTIARADIKPQIEPVQGKPVKKSVETVVQQVAKKPTAVKRPSTAKNQTTPKKQAPPAAKKPRQQAATKKSAGGVKQQPTKSASSRRKQNLKEDYDEEDDQKSVVVVEESGDEDDNESDQESVDN